MIVWHESCHSLRSTLMKTLDRNVETLVTISWSCLHFEPETRLTMSYVFLYDSNSYFKRKASTLCGLLKFTKREDIREVKHCVYGKRQIVSSCVSQKRENLLTCLTLLRSYSMYLVNRQLRKELTHITFLRVLAKLKLRFCRKRRALPL